MRTRSSAVLSLLLVLSAFPTEATFGADEPKAGANAARAVDALWRFDTEG